MTKLWIKRRLLLGVLCFVGTTILQQIAFAQKDNVHYTNLFQPDNRLKVSIHHNRTLGLGAQFVGVQVINVSNHKVKVELEYYVDLTCGERIIRKIGFGGGLFIQPGDTLKPAGFFDSDNTSFDAGNSRSSTCLASPNKSKKLDEGGYTCIDGVGFNILSVTEYDENNKPISSTNSTTTSSQGTTNSSSGSASGTEQCPYGSFSFTSQFIKENCATFVWLNQAPTLTATNDGGVITHGDYPANFIIQYKKASDSDWKELTVSGYGGNFTLENLEPCEKYHVRMQRDCGEGKKSVFTSTLTFSTLCHAPTFRKYESTTNTSVKLTYTRMQMDCGDAEAPFYVIEYRLGDSSPWQTKIFAAAQEKLLTNLKPGGQYQIRAKCQYDNGKYSAYSKVEIIHVLP